jgi:hypothetical protein
MITNRTSVAIIRRDTLRDKPVEGIADLCSNFGAIVDELIRLNI